MTDTTFINLDNRNKVNFCRHIKFKKAGVRTAMDVNEKVLKEVNEIHEMDQRFRRIGLQDSIIYYDSINRIRVMNLFEKYGFPNQNLIGSEFTKHSLAQNPLNVVILHFAQQGDKEILLKLKDLYDLNQVDQFFFSQIHSYGVTFGVKGYDGALYCQFSDALVEFNGKLCTYKCDSLEEIKINRNRDRLKMDRLDICIKKLISRYKYGFLFYEPASYISYYDTQDENTLKLLNAQLIPIEY